jgi:TonB family protein
MAIFAQMNGNGLRIGFLGACLTLAFSAHGRSSGAQELPKTPEEWLTRASNVTDIQRPGMPPFKLRARIRVLGGKNQPYEGTFEWLWLSATQWREQLLLPGFSRVRVGGKDKIWVQRSVPYEIAQSEQLDHLIAISSKLRVGPHEKLGKLEKKKESGVVQECVEIDRSPGGSKRLLCFDSATGGLAIEEPQSNVPPVLLPALITKTEYSDFRDWDGHSFPYSMIAFSGKRPLVEIHVEEIVSFDPSDASLFQPPTNSEEWEVCDSPEPPVLLESPRPKYPDDARRNSMTGVVQTYAAIETDGTLSHLAVVTSARPDMDRASLDALAQWRYKPQTCNGISVRTHTIITTTFWIP